MVKAACDDDFNPRAPRGARLKAAAPARRPQNISIHVPREGHDVNPPKVLTKFHVFQSTCPARGTTRKIYWRVYCLLISIHVPREGHDTLAVHKQPFKLCHFNPRAPRGARLAADSIKKTPRNFNPRAPRGARLVYHDRHRGGDRFQSTCPARGTTLPARATVSRRRRFQSTCPARGTTPPVSCIYHSSTNFNPRAPRGARRQGFLHCSQFV